MSETVTLREFDLHDLNEMIEGEWSAVDGFEVVWDHDGERLVLTAEVERPDGGEDRP